MDWLYRSENKYIGKGIAISIMELAKEVERLTGKNLIKSYDVPKEDWDQQQEERRIKTQNEIIRITPIRNNLISRRNKLQSNNNRNKKEENNLNGIIDELKDSIIPDPYIKELKPAWFNMVDTI